MTDEVECDRAVLFADLAGFTALTEAHGDREAAGIACRYYEIARSVLPHGARLVKTIGDAVMVTSEDAEDALAAALRLRQRVEVEHDFPDVRAGLHAGHCVATRRDYFGSAVNVAARIAAHARSGQILCSDAFAARLRPSETYTLIPLGPVAMKNIAHPVELLEIRDGAASHPAIAIDPICRMQVERETAAARLRWGSEDLFFCSSACLQLFLTSQRI